MDGAIGLWEVAVAVFMFGCLPKMVCLCGGFSLHRFLDKYGSTLDCYCAAPPSVVSVVSAVMM